MEVVKLYSWSEFRPQIDTITTKYRKSIVIGSETPILFRGQADSDWRLESTLERSSKMDWTVSSYAIIARRCLPQIESYTDYKWNLKPIEELLNNFTKDDNNLVPFIQDYEYWVYLRHHGFPSPLLDWSISPFVAAFFAFINPCPSDQVAIFVYIPTPTGMRAVGNTFPNIDIKEPYVSSHKRHFLQQSRYSICTIKEKNDFRFVCHENVFEVKNPSIGHEQDTLFKLLIPKSERLKALRELHEYNINSFSLMPSALSR